MITVYSKRGCVQCTATCRHLDRLGRDYTVVDLDAHPESLDRVTSLGYRQVPVVMADGQHWAGYRPDLLDALAPTSRMTA